LSLLSWSNGRQSCPAIIVATVILRRAQDDGTVLDSVQWSRFDKLSVTRRTPITATAS